MNLKRNEIDSGKETSESRNYDTLFGNGLTKQFQEATSECPVVLFSKGGELKAVKLFMHISMQ